MQFAILLVVGFVLCFAVARSISPVISMTHPGIITLTNYCLGFFWGILTVRLLTLASAP